MHVWAILGLCALKHFAKIKLNTALVSINALIFWQEEVGLVLIAGQEEGEGEGEGEEGRESGVGRVPIDGQATLKRSCSNATDEQLAYNYIPLQNDHIV